MQLRSREYIDNYKISWHEIYENIRIFRFASNFQTKKKFNFLSKENTQKLRKQKPENFETFLGMKFTQIYVFLGLHQTFKL